MINFLSSSCVLLVAGVADMQELFNGLGKLVQYALEKNSFSSHLFIFRGRRSDMIKIL